MSKTKRIGTGIYARTFDGESLNLIFRIPKNEDGQKFFELAKHYLNKGDYQFRKRGHGPKTSRYGGHVPVDNATWFAIYLIAKNITGKGDNRVIGKRTIQHEAKWEKRNHWLINRYEAIIQSDESKEKRIEMLREALNKQWEI